MNGYSKKLFLFDYKEITNLIEFYFFGNSDMPKKHLSTFIKIVFFPIFVILLTALMIVCGIYFAIALLIFALEYSIYVSFLFYPFIIPKFLVEIISYLFIFLGNAFFFALVILVRVSNKNVDFPQKEIKQSDEVTSEHNIDH